MKSYHPNPQGETIMKICSKRTLIGLDVHYLLSSKAPGCNLHYILVCGNPDEAPYHSYQLRVRSSQHCHYLATAITRSPKTYYFCFLSLIIVTYCQLSILSFSEVRQKI